MTGREKELFEFYTQYMRVHEECPTMRDVMSALEIKSWKGFYYSLRNLEKENRIELIHGKRHNVRLV